MRGRVRLYTARADARYGAFRFVQTFSSRANLGSECRVVAGMLASTCSQRAIALCTLGCPYGPTELANAGTVANAAAQGRHD